MKVDRTGGYEQFFGNGLIGGALPQQLDDLVFPVGEAAVGLAPEGLDDFPGDVIAQGCPLIADGIQGILEAVPGNGLCRLAHSPVLKGLFDYLKVVLLADHYDTGLRVFLPEFTDSFHAGSIRQVRL